MTPSDIYGQCNHSHLKLQAKMWNRVAYNEASVSVCKIGRLYWTRNTNLYL